MSVPVILLFFALVFALLDWATKGLDDFNRKD